MATKPSSPALDTGNGLSTGLKVGLLMQEGTGNPQDLSGNGNHGTLAGGASWTTDASGNVVACTGGGYISVPMPAVASGDDYSFLVIHKPTTWPGGFVALMDDTGRVWAVFLDASGNVSFTAANMMHGVGSGGAMAAGSVWQFLTVRESGTFKWYVNGTLIQTVGSDTSSTAGVTLRFGDAFSGGGTQDYDGKYDEICFWNRALSGAERTSLTGDPYQMFRGAAVGMTAAPTPIPKNHAGHITLTLTGTGTSWVNGTTVFTPSGVSGVTKISQNVTSATAATLVVTTGGSTGTCTITESVTGSTTANVTVGTPSFTISPTGGSVGSAPTVTFTGTNTVWTQETAAGLLSVSGGTGAGIGTPTVTTNTAMTAVLTCGSALATLTITETAGGVSQSFTVTRAAVTLVRVGDSLSSITLGYGGRTVPQIAAEAEQLFGGSLGTVTLVNVAAGGTATADWASGGSEHAGMISAVTANPGCWVTVMLGSNDVAAGTSQGTYSTRMAGIIADCVAAGAAGAILHQVVYRGDHAPGSAGDLLVQGYNAAVAALVNGTTIRRGDVLGYDWFLANLATDMGSDFVHFSGVGAEHAADMQAWAEYSALNPAAGGGTGGVSLARFAGGPL